jgi:hypothetical protein
MTFEEFIQTAMLPAECDDPEVMVGMRLCWDHAYSEGATYTLLTYLRKDNYDRYREKLDRKEDQNA